MLRRARCAILCQRQRQSHKANPVGGTRPGNLAQFSHERRGVFAQVQPTLTNPYLADELLQDIVIRHCPPEHFKRVSADLARMGERIVDEIDALGDECEANPPTLQRTDAWGNRVDKINCTRAWFDQHRVSAEEGTARKKDYFSEKFLDQFRITFLEKFSV